MIKWHSPKYFFQKIDGQGFKVAMDALTMNVFIRQNIGRSITFKTLISRTVQSRFRQNLAEILENDQSASGLFYIEWMAF